MAEETRSSISEEKARSSMNDKEREAEEILKNAKKAGDLLDRLLKLLGKIKKIPVIGDFVDDLSMMGELIGDYVKGKYRDIPVGIILAALAAIIYLVSPFDLISDFIPGVGFLDDAAVLSLTLAAGLSSELGKYRQWKEDTGCKDEKAA
jgi:uncharacterized membrane protein YkvA (DUF1232 family)